MASPEVVQVIPLGNHTEVELVSRAAALEARSTHPLARAIRRYAERKGIAPAPAADVQVLRGKGLTGIFDGEPFWLGSHRYVVERGQDAPEVARQAEALEADGKTVIVVGNSRHVLRVLLRLPILFVQRREKSCGNFMLLGSRTWSC